MDGRGPKELNDEELKATIWNHSLFALFAGGLTAVALLLPTFAWYWSLLRVAGGSLALLFGAMNLIVAVGARAEMQARQGAAEPDPDPDEPGLKLLK